MTNDVNNASSQFDEQQLSQLKIALKDQLIKSYASFISIILKIPGDKKGREEAMRFFDTGFIWFEKSIDNFSPRVSKIQESKD